MAALENVSTDDLRQVLVAVERKKPTQRPMAAINHLKDDDLTQKEVAERYGYTGDWLSRRRFTNRRKKSAFFLPCEHRLNCVACCEVHWG